MYSTRSPVVLKRTANLYVHLDLENAMLQSADRLSNGLFGKEDTSQNGSVQADLDEAVDKNQKDT